MHGGIGFLFCGGMGFLDKLRSLTQQLDRFVFRMSAFFGFLMSFRKSDSFIIGGFNDVAVAWIGIVFLTGFRIQLQIWGLFSLVLFRLIVGSIWSLLVFCKYANLSSTRFRRLSTSLKTYH